MMLCFVKNPNQVVLEVNVDCKAKGQECLDKVCQMLGIIEVDYFGLQYTGNHGEILWLNMRNSIRQQLNGPPPYRLKLKVKFFVPPHLLLQETTRHQFYLNILKDFQTGKLLVDDKRKAIQLTALYAQAELGDLDSSNKYVSALLAYPKLIPMLFEINDEELSSPLLSSYQQRQGKRRKHHSGASEPDSFSDIEQSNFASYCEHLQLQHQRSQQASTKMSLAGTATRTEESLTLDICDDCSDKCTNDINQLTTIISQLHRKLKGLRKCKAEYLFLKEVSKLEGIGVEYFFVKSNLSSDDTFLVGLGPKGVTIKEEKSDEFLYRIEYASIQIATQSGRSFFLTFTENNGELKSLEFKCESIQASNSIYRAITEKHAFYSCDTVRNTVTSQYIRDLKGTIVSLFDENTPLGKNYVFDIRRTFREVYDHTRRLLYSLETKAKEVVSGNSGEVLTDVEQQFFDDYYLNKIDEITSSVDEELCQRIDCQDTRKKLSSLQDSMLCRVCMDSDVCTAFFPCGHVVCCLQCAPLCDLCPLCRSSVENFHHIYLPVNCGETDSSPTSSSSLSPPSSNTFHKMVNLRNAADKKSIEI